MASRSKAALLLCGCLWGARAALGVSADEPALASLWSLQQQPADNHLVVAAACAQFEKSQPQSLFLPVSRGLAAWHLLQDGNLAAATSLLQTMVSTNAAPVPKAGDEMARRWLTRLDREKVKAALRKFYGHHIVFPDSLAALEAAPAAPTADRWGAPWQYQLTKLKHVSGVDRQTFELLSTHLAATSDLAVALRLPYTGASALEPVRVEGPSVVTFTQNGQNMVLSEGGSVGSTTFVYLGSQCLILSDGDHWRLTPRPGGAAQ